MLSIHSMYLYIYMYQPNICKLLLINKSSMRSDAMAMGKLGTLGLLTGCRTSDVVLAKRNSVAITRAVSGDLRIWPALNMAKWNSHGRWNSPSGRIFALLMWPRVHLQIWPMADQNLSYLSRTQKMLFSLFSQLDIHIFSSKIGSFPHLIS